jgi:hypothetical protein
LGPIDANEQTAQGTDTMHGFVNSCRLADKVFIDRADDDTFVLRLLEMQSAKITAI